MNDEAKTLADKPASEITMRDYIAIEAMKAYLSNGSGINSVKTWAHDAADKMLEESVRTK
jgi:hypothetical protein